MEGSSAARQRVLIDVGDLLRSPWRAGIQRVVAELVHELGELPELEVVPVVWFDAAREFRELTPSERAQLRDGTTAHSTSVDERADSRDRPEVPTSDALDADARPPSLRRAALVAARMLRLESLLRRARRWLLRATSERSLVPLVVVPGQGDVLLEMDTVWNNSLVDRSELYRSVRERGGRIAVVVYDLLPQTHPEWFEASMVEVSTRTLRAQATADVVMAISRHTATELTDWARRSGLEPATPAVIQLGADPRVGPEPSGDRGVADPSTRPTAGPTVPTVLMVGTVEPRKNHALALDVMDELWGAGVDVSLTVIGRAGWRADDVQERLLAHPEHGRRLRWLRDVDDVGLAGHYRDAHLVIVPSLEEGYGLPVVEALRRGVPVVASDRGALPEAGGGLAEHIDPGDLQRWCAAVRRHLDDAEYHLQRRALVAEFDPPQWSDTAREVSALLIP